MNQEKPKTYTAEFRSSAVKLANESDKPITQVAKDLGINVNTGVLGTTEQLWEASHKRPTAPQTPNATEPNNSVNNGPKDDIQKLYKINRK